MSANIKSHIKKNSFQSEVFNFRLSMLNFKLFTFNFKPTTLNFPPKSYNLKLTTFSIILFIFSASLFNTSCSSQKNPINRQVQNSSVPSNALIYDDINYISSIKSVEFYNDKKVGSFPLISLETSERLILKFDDLRGGSRNLTYYVVHCEADWTVSQISPIEYLESFSEDRITNYRFSFNTYQTYTHYEMNLPNFAIIPKLSGNYLLKVYENGDQSKLLLSRRFYVLQQKASVQAEINRSNIVSNRDSHQKINFSVFHPGINIQNPYQDIKTVVMQNGRSSTAQLSQRPLFIRTNQLVFNDDRNNDFEGGNEFRRFDTRTLRFKMEGVYQITKDSLYNALLFGDVSKNTRNYSYQFDENGNFYIKNQDGTTNDYDADYARINFVLKAEQPSPNGAAYVVGKFNAYQTTKENQMVYDEVTKTFTLTMPLKQGVFDYHYLWKENNESNIDEHALDGSFYETENNYQILVYYHSPNSRYDELISYTELNSATRPRNY